VSNEIDLIDQQKSGCSILGMAHERVSPQNLCGTEMSFDEIAHELGIKPNTVRMHFQHGMAKLRTRRRTPAFQALHDLTDDMARLR